MQHKQIIDFQLIIIVCVALSDCSHVLLLEGLSDKFELVDDVDVLGALALALAALDTVTGFAVAFGQQVVIELAVTLLIRELLQVVVQVEVFGDDNLHRATVSAVVACSAGDGYRVADNFGGAGDNGLFLVVEGMEILHIGSVVVDLLKRTHAA